MATLIGDSKSAVQPSEEQQVVLDEQIGHIRVVTLNSPRKLNIISSKVVSRLAELFEKWEDEKEAEIIIIKGTGRAFSAGGDLKMFYEGKADESWIEVVYRMYWLLYHLHTYKKTLVAIVHGLAMGGGASFAVPSTFSVVTENTVFATPEAGFGFHTDCSFSYVLSHLPGHLGEYLALTGARFDGAEMVATGLATHYVPSKKLPELEKRLVSLSSGEREAVKASIEEFSIQVKPGEKSILNNIPLIDKCFSKDTVEEIIESLVAESNTEGNEWVKETIKTLKRSSPSGLKITLQSIRRGRKQILFECLKKEFRLTINTLRGLISNDMYEGIRAIMIEKDNSPKWNPLSLSEITEEKLELVFNPFKDEFELQLPEEGKIARWEGKYENSSYQKK
ncbi:3-hydroxyisobutyryl-CoA hydrolase-like protein 5 isoform X1 [Cryptomeria japonica]|uniref:3-hydroxyisobutyryl-CoA hydrolase-like protein 5 isoform X1 n=1 Tax=Cryptomeria japonica TaxID=3369 RepID=UPI0027DA049D|nr:3-hydroxyisobutyryl-CoA hydrolase-like protein 5 isoform X1 [Cryptomeria japonica]XP_057817067.2 3-hydroxyisobutyryl-CoA hydrolase-like protein 5 isoform X1 [Cryptomeria japonica]XP_057817068.2 3-hydroxyisobutyryl-CoA hydrolase-like protein 5 isoform X1 [Cryptomeria japonica]